MVLDYFHITVNNGIKIYIILHVYTVFGIITHGNNNIFYRILTVPAPSWLTFFI